MNAEATSRFYSMIDKLNCEAKQISLALLNRHSVLGTVRREEMPPFLSRLGNVLPFSKLLRQLETDMETVVKVLQPGPLGIIEHKFSAEEIQRANATVQKAVENWRRNANLDQGSEIIKDFIDR